jgi:hypothetical protein
VSFVQLNDLFFGKRSIGAEQNDVTLSLAAFRFRVADKDQFEGIDSAVSLFVPFLMSVVSTESRYLLPLFVCRFERKSS